MAVYVRPTAGLLLVFTLLALIIFSNSLLDDDNLGILQEYMQGGIVEAAKKKAQLVNALKAAELYHEAQFERIYPILQQLIAITDRSASLQELKTVVVNFLVKKKTDFANGKKALEKEIEDIWAYVRLQEESIEEL